MGQPIQQGILSSLYHPTVTIGFTDMQIFYVNTLLNATFIRRSRWPFGQTSRSAAAGLLGLRLWIPLGAWMSEPCQCCVLSGREISGPEEPCRVWRVCCVIAKRQQWVCLGPRRADAITRYFTDYGRYAIRRYFT